MHLFRIKRFALSEDGAVTVDWVVITAAIVSLSVAVMMTTVRGTKTASCNVSGQVSAASGALTAGWNGIPQSSGSC